MGETSVITAYLAPLRLPALPPVTFFIAFVVVTLKGYSSSSMPQFLAMPPWACLEHQASCLPVEGLASVGLGKLATFLNSLRQQ